MNIKNRLLKKIMTFGFKAFFIKIYFFKNFIVAKTILELSSSFHHFYISKLILLAFFYEVSIPYIYENKKKNTLQNKFSIKQVQNNFLFLEVRKQVEEKFSSFKTIHLSIYLSINVILKN